MQIIIPLIVSLLVSIFAWTLTYILPFVIPSQLSKTILKLTEHLDPEDPIEIRLLVDQFLKYDDWKRLTAKERLKRIFERKIVQVERKEFANWQKLIGNVTYKPIKEFIEDIENSDISDKQKHMKTCLDFQKRHEKAKVWFFKDADELPLNRYSMSKYNKPLTTRELAVLQTIDFPVFDEEGNFTEEMVLKRVLNENPPKSYTSDKRMKIFEDILLYIVYPHEANYKEKMLYKFSIGLSHHSESSKELQNLIEIVNTSIKTKEYQDKKKKLNSIGSK